MPGLEGTGLVASSHWPQVWDSALRHIGLDLPGQKCHVGDGRSDSTNESTGMFGNVHTPVASMLLPVLPSSKPFSVVRHLMLYPPAHTKTPAPARLRAAKGRSSSMTDQTQRQPSGGARFMTAR